MILAALVQTVIFQDGAIGHLDLALWRKMLEFLEGSGGTIFYKGSIEVKSIVKQI